MDAQANITQSEPAPDGQEPETAASRHVRINPARVLLSSGLGVLITFSLLRFISGVVTFIRFQGAGFDFSSYYAAALALRSNPHADIFNIHVLEAATAAHHLPFGGVTYLYPPFLAVIIIPLTLLPFRSALQLWIIGNGLLWVGCGLMLARWSWQALMTGASRAATLRDAPARLAAGFALTLVLFLTAIYLPFGENLGLGQVSGAILFLVLLAWLLLEHGHARVAGVVLALAIWIKLLPALLVVYLLLQRRWRVVIWATSACLLIGLGMVPIIGIQGVLATRFVLTNGGHMANMAHNMALARVPLWLTYALGGTPGRAAALAGYGLIALVAILFILGIRYEQRQPILPDAMRAEHETLGYFWALATMVVISPLTWEHHDVWLLPALFISFFTALPHAARGLRDERGHIHPEIVLAFCAALGYALTMGNMPFGYDGASHFVLGPYAGSIALRPYFMLLRPAGAVLAWAASGALYLWPRRVSPATASAEGERLLRPQILAMAMIAFLVIAMVVQGSISQIQAAFS